MTKQRKEQMEKEFNEFVERCVDFLKKRNESKEIIEEGRKDVLEDLENKNYEEYDIDEFIRAKELKIKIDFINKIGVIFDRKVVTTMNSGIPIMNRLETFKQELVKELSNETK